MPTGLRAVRQFWLRMSGKTDHLRARPLKTAKIWIETPWPDKHTGRRVHGSRQKSGTANSWGHVALVSDWMQRAFSTVPVFVMLPSFVGKENQKGPQKQVTYQGGVVDPGRQTPVRLRPHQYQQSSSQDQELPNVSADFAIFVLDFGSDGRAHGE